MKKLLFIGFLSCFLQINAQVIIAPFLRYNQPLFFKDSRFPKVYNILPNFGGSGGLVLYKNRFVTRLSYDVVSQKYQQEMDSFSVLPERGTYQNYTFSRQQVQLTAGYVIKQSSKWKVSVELGIARTVTVLERIKIFDQNGMVKKYKYYNYNPWKWSGYAYSIGLHAQKTIGKNMALQLSTAWQQQISGDYSHKKELNLPISTAEGNIWVRPYHYPNNLKNYFLSFNVGLQFNLAPFLTKKN